MRIAVRYTLLGLLVFVLVACAAMGLYAHANRFVAPQARHPPAPLAEVAPAPDDLQWHAYGGDDGQTRHAGIRQIDRGNVGHLREAWTYRTGELARRDRWGREGKFQATPIIAGGSLVLCTPFGRVIALDPATGAQRWVHDPQIRFERRPDERFNCRGLARWVAAAPVEAGSCNERLILATTDRRIVALDAASGEPCAGFGRGGEVQVPLDRADVREGELQFAAAPAVIGDTIVVGSASGDNGRIDAPSGAVRAFDARTGAQRWSFDPIPRTHDPVASPTWHGDSAARTGQANVWGSITVDAARDLVFVPTSSPSPDYYGGLRKGANLYANSMVALRASTGERVWHFQTVHHDLWDYDLPAGPTLLDIRPADAPPGAAAVPALAFATKSGFLYLLHRETGEPLAKVEERPVPPSDVPGEWTSPTQPWSVGLPAITPQALDVADPFGLLVFDRRACAEAMSAARYEGLFTPPTTGHGTLVYPMGAGGANWGGLALDPARNRVFVNTNNAVQHVTLLASEEAERRRRTERDREVALMRGAPFGMMRAPLLSPIGLPCNQPPWGQLSAVDLATGRIAWQVPLGNTRKLAPLGIALPLGTPNFGGPIVTDGGLVFIAATMDNLLRAFDADTGEELWAGELPYAGHATPMTYATGGRQYVVVVAGGHPVLGNEIGDAVVAFALPRR